MDSAGFAAHISATTHATASVDSSSQSAYSIPFDNRRQIGPSVGGTGRSSGIEGRAVFQDSNRKDCRFFGKEVAGTWCVGACIALAVTFIAEAKRALGAEVICGGSASVGYYVVQPRDFVSWVVEIQLNNQRTTFSGRGQVDATGALELGRPYGMIDVGGLKTETVTAMIKARIRAQIARDLANTTRSSGTKKTNSKGHNDPRIKLASWLTEDSGSWAGAKQESGSSYHPTSGSSFAPGAPESKSPAQSAGPAAVPSNNKPGPTTATIEGNNLKRALTQLDPDVRKSEISPPKVFAGAREAESVWIAPPAVAAEGGMPREGAKVSLPAYVVEPPDILLIESTQGLRDQPIRGQHLVRPDGTISLGIYGSVRVAGFTLEQVRQIVFQIAAARVQNFDIQNLSVDVLAYNSKVYYVITDGGGYGEQVYRFPVTGSETVLDALSQITGLPPVASKSHIWVARPSPDGSCSGQTLPVDWRGITRCAMTATNYQIMPGDRIYVMADKWITFDSRVAKILAPFERMVGFTLLTSETVNSIRNRQNGTLP
jgi:polysaccharide export outer membrane protein